MEDGDRRVVPPCGPRIGNLPAMKAPEYRWGSPQRSRRPGWATTEGPCIHTSCFHMAVSDRSRLCKNKTVNQIPLKNTMKRNDLFCGQNERHYWVEEGTSGWGYLGIDWGATSGVSTPGFWKKPTMFVEYYSSEGRGCFIHFPIPLGRALCSPEWAGNANCSGLRDWRCTQCAGECDLGPSGRREGRDRFGSPHNEA